jgi:DNA-binding GntR family transcriptional regulator
LASRLPLLLTTERIIEGTTSYIQQETGEIAVSTYVQHAAGFASEDDAKELRVEVGSPVLLSRNRFLNADGTVIEYGESTALPDHWVFYEYTIEDSK